MGNDRNLVVGDEGWVQTADTTRGYKDVNELTFHVNEGMELIHTV